MIPRVRPFEAALALAGVLAGERPEDRVPERPMALYLLEESMIRPDVIERLSLGAYSAKRIDYRPLDPGREIPGEDPFRREGITLTLEAPGHPPLVLEK